MITSGTFSVDQELCFNMRSIFLKLCPL